MATAIASCGVSPVVRIAANEGWMVKREGPCLALDPQHPLSVLQAHWILEVACRQNKVKTFKSISIDRSHSSWHHCAPFVHRKRR